MLYPEFSNKRQLMHAKAVIIDSKKAIVTSANMTLNGMHKNIEIGVVVEGKTITDLINFTEDLLLSNNVVEIHDKTMENQLSKLRHK